MGKYLEIDDKFDDIWCKLDAIKWDMYYIDSADKADEVCRRVYDVQQMCLELQDKFEDHFKAELDKEMKEEGSE